MDPDILKLLELIIPLMAVAMAIGMVGWFANTWLRIKHGYPLDGAWGRPVYPRSDQEVQERVRLLTSENAQLRAQLGKLQLHRAATGSAEHIGHCLLYTSPSPRDPKTSRMPSSA